MKTTFPVSSGLLDVKHVLAIGSAIWCFLWCIDRTTRDWQKKETCWGQVLGGYDVPLARIAHELGISERTVRTQLSHLHKFGYIRLTRHSHGQRIEVARSIKWRRRVTRVAQPASEPQVLLDMQSKLLDIQSKTKAEENRLSRQ